MVASAPPIRLLPLFLPPIAWWAAARGQAVKLSVQDRYQTQTELHRCWIKAAGGPLLLVVPVKKTSKYGSIDDAQIDNRRDWSRPLRQSLRSAYGKSPYFLYYRELIDHIGAVDRLAVLNVCLIRWIYQALDWQEALLTTSEHESAIDCRFVGLRGQALPGFQAQTYWQPFGPFAANLSIVDALFQLGPDLDTYLKQCQPGSATPRLVVSE
jgi:hypothetical protein